MRRGASHTSSTFRASNQRRSNRENYGEGSNNFFQTGKKNQISKIQNLFSNELQETFIQKEFSLARTKLNQLLKEYSFVRVLEIKYMSKTDLKHEFFFGKCETISNSLYGDKTIPKILFFDKAGRNKHETLNIGPCKLVDCAWGKEHASGKIDVGDILVGIQTTNPRSGTKIDRILTSWSKQGKILLDVSRMVEHGTKASMKDMRHYVQQKQCDLALQAQTFPSSFFHNSMGGFITQESLKRMASCKDDMYVLLSIVLWGNIRPLAVMYSLNNKEGVQCKEPPTEQEKEFCSKLTISEKPEDFIALLSNKLEDPSIISEFYEFFDEIKYPTKENENLYVPQSMYNSTILQNGGYGFSEVSNISSFVQDMYGSQTPKYVPSSPITSPKKLNSDENSEKVIFCDLYSPESPIDSCLNSRIVPSSPPYVPKSPEESPPQSPIHSPPSSPTAQLTTKPPTSNFTNSTPQQDSMDLCLPNEQSIHEKPKKTRNRKTKLKSEEMIEKSENEKVLKKPKKRILKKEEIINLL